MPQRSPGVIAFRRKQGTIEVQLVRSGGPFWHNKDIGGWSIPKGEYGAGETPEDVARREFREELGIMMTKTCFRSAKSGSVRQEGHGIGSRNRRRCSNHPKQYI